MGYKDGKYIVYKHTAPNGKAYIGITHQTPNNRWRIGGKGYSKSPVFYKAIKKYGFEKFKHEILFENLNYNEACLKEIELIKQFNTLVPNGYNVDEGGYRGTKFKKKIIAFNEQYECRLFSSITDAADEFGIVPSTISHIIGKPIKGGGWFYIYAN